MAQRPDKGQLILGMINRQDNNLKTQSSDEQKESVKNYFPRSRAYQGMGDQHCNTAVDSKMKLLISLDEIYNKS
jgi:hypothetical protein